jgi:hypothetical protein
MATEDMQHSESFEIKAVRDAISHIAEINGIKGYEPGWMPPVYNDPNHVAPDHGGALFVANVLMAAAATGVVLGRTYTRAFVAGGLGGDDYAMLGAVVSFPRWAMGWDWRGEGPETLTVVLRVCWLLQQG